MDQNMTPAQKERQHHREAGKYAKVNPCRGCGKSAGVNYFSHNLTDNGWDDLAICLCESCADATGSMTDPLDFLAFAEQHGGVKPEDAARARKYWVEGK